MGFFSDMIKMAASEVVNAVIEGVNENAMANEEREQHLEEFRQRFYDSSYSSLLSWLEYAEFSEDEHLVIKELINERTQMAKGICTSSEEAFAMFDDEELIKFYNKLLEHKGDYFPEEYAKKVVRIFQNELMSRNVAKMMYADEKSGCFENERYDNLGIIVEGNNVFYDEILKREAENELRYRNLMIESLSKDNIDELENDEFMEIYDLVRNDRAERENIRNEEGFCVELGDIYYNYFGEYRNQLLKNCEYELLINRKYLLKPFLQEYCEDEFEELLNYSNKKLSSVISLVEEGDIECEYDLCYKLIAQLILSERGCE